MNEAAALPAKPPQNGGTGSHERNSKLRDLTESRQRQLMVAMWHRMGAFFGATWESQYGTTENQTIQAWQGALSDLTVGELAHGIKCCEQWDDTFPPTFPKFRGLCLSARNRQRNVTEERIERERRAGKSDAMLEHLARNAASEVAKRELERMADIHAGVHVESIEKSRHNLELHRRWPGPWPGQS